MTWTAPTPSPVDGPVTGDDRAILEGCLNWQRATLLNIYAGLTGEQLARRPIPSSTSPCSAWSGIWPRWNGPGSGSAPPGRMCPPMYPPSAGKDADFNDAEASQAPADFSRLQAEWQSADESVRQMRFADTFDAGGGERWSLRMMYVHLIGEYAQHNGHADLLRGGDRRGHRPVTRPTSRLRAGAGEPAGATGSWAAWCAARRFRAARPRPWWRRPPRRCWPTGRP